MPISLPIADTPNNINFLKYLDNIIDGDEFHQRHETKNFVFNIITDKYISITSKGYYSRVKEFDLIVTHKPSGSLVIRYGLSSEEDRRDYYELLKNINTGDEQAIIKSSFGIPRGIGAYDNQVTVGDLVDFCVKRNIEIPDQISDKVIQHLNTPVDKAIHQPVVLDFVEMALKEMPEREKDRLTRMRGMGSTVSNRYYRKMGTSYKLSTEQYFSVNEKKGGKDISRAINIEHHSPMFLYQGEKGYEYEDIEDRILLEINSRRRSKVSSIYDNVNEEALLLSALKNRSSDVTESEVRSDIENAIPVIKESCGEDQANWSYFLTKSHQQIRNRAQILNGPLNKSVSGLGILLGDEDFKKAIDKGGSLREVARKLPLMNTSKRTVNALLNNISSVGGYPNERKRTYIITEKGRLNAPGAIRHTELKRNADIGMIATLQSIPDKYFNSDPNNLRNVYLMPHINTSLPATIKKVREGDWSPQQAFQWINRISDDKERDRLFDEIHDTENILANFYIKTIASFVMHRSGVTYENIEDFCNSGATISMSDSIIDTIAETKPYSAIISLSTDIHKYSQDLMKIGSPKGEVSWDPSIEQDFEYGGVTITPIHSTTEMSMEGLILNHCVGTYIQSAMQGESFILGVRSPDGERLSTIEIGPGENEPFEIRQHYAHSNSEPSDIEIKAAEKLMQKINSQEIAFNTETNVSEERLSKLHPLDRAEIQTGLRFSDPKVVIRALKHLEDMSFGANVLEVVSKNMLNNRLLFHEREYVADELNRLKGMRDNEINYSLA